MLGCRSGQNYDTESYSSAVDEYVLMPCGVARIWKSVSSCLERMELRRRDAHCRASRQQLKDLVGDLKRLRNGEKGSIDGVATMALNEAVQTIEAMIKHADDELSVSRALYDGNKLSSIHGKTNSRGAHAQRLRFARLPATHIEEMAMDNHIISPPQAIITVILLSLLVSAHALAQDNTNAADLQIIPTAPALQNTSNDDCYRGQRNRRLMLRITDLSSLWHYAARILLPTASTSAAPRHEIDKRKTEKGVVWRVGTEHSGVVVSANLAW